MKKFFNLILPVLLSLIAFYGCQDHTDLTGPSSKSGSADLSTLVTIGNSITAGYQSGALYQSAQVYCYGNLIAQQVNSNFAIPYISDPGLGNLMKVKSFDLATGTINITTVNAIGAPINSGYANPYNNLGIPGAVLYDVLNATTSTNCGSALAGGSPNILFDVILRGKGSQFTQAKALKPTFVTLWIGNNDVLGFSTSGGTSPSAPTDANLFQKLFQALGDSLATLGAKVVVANIPDVTSVPFFTTVGPAMARQLPWALITAAGAPGVFYQSHGNNSADATYAYADSAALASGTVLITLPGSTYASLIGQPSGQFYRDYGYTSIPLGIDTTKPFGLHPQNPWPDALILDATEINTAKTATANFNATIAGVASAKGFGLVDINTFFNTVAKYGLMENGIGFDAEYFIGGLFGLDGVHPTSRGQAVIANEFLKVINSKFVANYSLVNVATIPSSIMLAKKSSFANGNFPHFDPGSFKHLLD